MDLTAQPFNSYEVDYSLSDRKRMDSFKFGKSMPSSTPDPSIPRSHVRSHSRKMSSVSTLSSSTSLNSISISPSPPLSMTETTPPSSPVRSSMGGSKRNSHHRRRSSVSTRRESAEIMGVSLPTIPLSVSDDNINLGDKDSVRRRALWALEGKTDVGSFSRVSIPELETSEAENKPYEFPTKPSYPPGIGAGYVSKRDSFGKFMPSSNTKEQLGTLMEEEEEEEEENECDATVTSSPVDQLSESIAQVVVSTPSPAPTRHRPATLNLRPLSLHAGNILSQGDLPTPDSASPSPLVSNTRPGLKSLTLPATHGVEPVEEVSSVARKRRSLMILPNNSPTPLTRRPSLNIAADVPTPPSSCRRSSISYYSSSDSISLNHGLPTPEMTPTADRRTSTSSTDSSLSRTSSRGSRPLSISEQHFLFQAHQTLVQRISDLERALSARPRSRPQSYSSDVSAQSEPPSDEMLLLITDLKAERDELKKDVDGWKTRLSDSEKQTSLLMKRIEAERREAWVARERASLMETEKRSLERTLMEKTTWGEDGWSKFRAVQTELTSFRQECDRLRSEVHKVSDLEAECVKLRAQLSDQTSRREELEKELEMAGLLATPTPRAFTFGGAAPIAPRSTFKKRGLGFRSIDSESSFTDVDSLDGSIDRNHFGLKAVEEEEENGDSNDSNTDCSDDDNELASYEDECEDDEFAFHASFSSSSFGSEDDFAHCHALGDALSDVPPLSGSRSRSTTPSPLPTPEPVHGRRESLSKTWSFPRKVHSAGLTEPEEVDHFFGCLEDVDNSPPLDARLRSIESDKNIFSQALADHDDEIPPFILPLDVGVEVESPEILPVKSVLNAVVEEDEEEDEDDDEKELEGDESTSSPMGPNDEFVGEEVEGGIIFTFAPPPSFDDELNDSTNDLDDSANLNNSMSSDASFEAKHSSVTNLQILHRSPSTPSSIPRLSRAALVSPSSTSTPVKRNTVGFPLTCNSPSSFSTPPSHRGPQPTFIPQPRKVVSPSSSSPPKSIPVGSPPSRIPVSSTSQTKLPSSIFDDPFTSRPSTTSSHVNHPQGTSSEAPTSPSSPIVSPTIAALQKLTNFIPMPWSPRSTFSSVIPQSSTSSNSFDRHPPTTSSPTITERGFVSKESQLEKLRLRLAQEKYLINQERIREGAVRNTQHHILHI
ncbi:hypothetical protein C8Q75DRAFT_867195 [Abortiporus biennis]|nr:hypothetical protein C8Q75DRAFT_867195 [Abortiporus biennis]